MVYKKKELKKNNFAKKKTFPWKKNIWTKFNKKKFQWIKASLCEIFFFSFSSVFKCIKKVIPYVKKIQTHLYGKYTELLSFLGNNQWRTITSKKRLIFSKMITRLKIFGLKYSKIPSANSSFKFNVRKMYVQNSCSKNYD